MKLLQPTPPPYDALEWERLPLEQRGEQACQSWAMQGYGTPSATYVFYAAKVAFYVAMWSWFCGFSSDLGSNLSGKAGAHHLGGLLRLDAWWSSPVAFQKAILWSMLFEGLGLGCGSGPLTGRYLPPIGGFLYFLRPGTTKLALFPKAPLLGGIRRSWLDVALYLALVVALGSALLAPVPPHRTLLAIAILVPLLGLADRTIFLALRAEHYWTTIVCFAFAGNWIAGAMAVQLALWFWAGFSKLNAHFPTVVCVMTSNSPVARFTWLRRLMYRDYPADLRPSALATAMGHAGTALELGIPLLLLLGPLVGATPWTLPLAMILMMLLHGFITSNVPMGVPIEWNVMVVYGGFALFWAHRDVSIFALGSMPGSLPLAAFLAAALLIVPLAGNLWPQHISFLLAMRYYAGNWAYGVWLFRGESYRKLEQLTATSPWVYDQLAHFYDRRTSVGLVGKVLAFRMMHLHGRALPILVPKAISNLRDYEYLDGELVAGLVLGWNFGDGHLHNEALLAAVQAQCGFAAGELRCIFVESQPLGGKSLAYRIVDACAGPLEAGALPVAELRQRQPWEAA
jgi:Transmembrane protein of unknown function (DUF3556)